MKSQLSKIMLLVLTGISSFCLTSLGMSYEQSTQKARASKTAAKTALHANNVAN